MLDQQNLPLVGNHKENTRIKNSCDEKALQKRSTSTSLCKTYVLDNYLIKTEGTYYKMLVIFQEHEKLYLHIYIMQTSS